MDPVTPVAAGLVLSAAGLAYVVRKDFQRANARADRLKRLAGEFGGRTSVGDSWWRRLFDRSLLSIPLAGASRQAEVSHYQTRDSDPQRPVQYTDFAAPVREASAGWTLAVRPQRAFDAIGRVLGRQDIRVGRPELDDALVIKSDNEIQAAIFFAQEGACEALLRLYRLEGTDHVELSLDRDELQIRKLGHLDEDEQLRPFVRACATLYRSLPKELAYPLPAKLSDALDQAG